MNESRSSEGAALVRRYYAMWNAGHGALADALLGPTYLDHAQPDVVGPAAVRSLAPRFHAADPSAQWSVEIAAADDEFVAARTTLTKTVRGKAESTAGIAIFRIADGKLAEQWSWESDGAAARALREATRSSDAGERALMERVRRIAAMATGESARVGA